MKKYTIDEVLLTYNSWMSARARCSKNNKQCTLTIYGKNNILFLWGDFKSFIKDVGPRPSQDHTLDRYPNLLGNYEPGNVRWATKTEQAINRVTTINITYKNKTQSISDWSKEFEIPKSTLYERIKKGWAINESFNYKDPDLSKKEPKSNKKIKGKYTVDQILLTFSSWSAIKSRTNLNTKNKNYKEYYIKNNVLMYEPWKKDFKLFFNDVGPRPSKDHTLDRFPNSNGNYEPGNVRWATKKEQSVNRKTTRLVSYNGKTLPISYWAKKLKMSTRAIDHRLKKGWSVEKTFTTPLQKKNPSFLEGRQNGKKLSRDDVLEIVKRLKSKDYKTKTALGKEFGISNTTIWQIENQFKIKR